MSVRDNELPWNGQFINFTRQLHLSCPFFYYQQKYCYITKICQKYADIFTYARQRWEVLIQPIIRFINFKRLPTKSYGAFNFIMRKSGYFEQANSWFKVVIQNWKLIGFCFSRNCKIMQIEILLPNNFNLANVDTFCQSIWKKLYSFKTIFEAHKNAWKNVMIHEL